MTTTARTSLGDLAIPRVILTDPEQIAAQTVRDGLALWKTEWFLDRGAGFPWLQFLGVKVFNANQLANALKAFLLSVPGIVAVIAESTFDRAARAFAYSYQCTFNSGAIISGSSSSPAVVQGAS